MTTTSEKSTSENRYIIGSAYINDIIIAEEKVGERFSSSISREEFEKLEANDKGEVKISFFENDRKREDKKDPDLNILPGIKSEKSLASIFINKDEVLAQPGEKYIRFMVTDKKSENLKSEKSRNMVVFSNERDESGSRQILGSGWNEKRLIETKENAKSQTVKV